MTVGPLTRIGQTYPSESALVNAARVTQSPFDSVESDHLSEREYKCFAEFIAREVGVKLPAIKKLMVEGRLRKRIRILGLNSFGTYCSYVFERGGLDSERPHLIDAITTHKTDFFREPEHFDYLEHKIVPELLEVRKIERQPLLKIWSAACSNGAEPYSIAMLLADMATAQGKFRFSVLGTDVSTEVLTQGMQAIYPAEMMVPVCPERQDRYVMHTRQSSSWTKVRIVPELRRLVHFEQLNLMAPGYPFDHDVDVIFLRNVLIYFEKKDQEAVVNKLVGHLRPNGYLILGHAESMIGACSAMPQVAPAIFRKM